MELSLVCVDCCEDSWELWLRAESSFNFKLATSCLSSLFSSVTSFNFFFHSQFTESHFDDCKRVCFGALLYTIGESWPWDLLGSLSKLYRRAQGVRSLTCWCWKGFALLMPCLLPSLISVDSKKYSQNGNTFWVDRNSRDGHYGPCPVNIIFEPDIFF